MRKFLISAATALTFGVTAFFVIPESSAQIIPQPPCRCGSGTQEVFKVTKNLLTGVVSSRVFMGCMTQAQIGALPPLPITNPATAQSYELGCGSIVAGH
ncbi:MAG: hypothetical protein EOP54_15455 [Sphingobacteriales bacterium]|nr:MAG: hypothetical protein EOP54_15455 [Sphingobacteriales bacterium]